MIGFLRRLRPSRGALFAFGIALATGAMLGVSASWGPLPALAFFFPVPLLALMQARPGPRQAFYIGWGAGIGCNAMAFYWLVGLLEAFAGFPTPLALLVALLLFVAQGLLLAFALWMTAACVQRGAVAAYVLPLAVTAMFTLSPSLFPWRPASASLGWLHWAQIGDLGGPPLLDVMLLGAACATYECFRTRSRIALAVAAFCYVAPAAYGLFRLPQIEALRAEAPSIRIGVVQPNIDIVDKHDRRQRPAQLRQLRRLTAEIEDATDLVLWPETAYPFPLRRGATREPAGRAALHADGVTGPLLVGALTIEEGDRCAKWNSAIAYDADGRIVGVSDKVELLAFGETVPLHAYLPPLQDMFACPGVRAGDAAQVLEVADVRVGVLNCYEDVLSEHARGLAAQGPELLVNLTNDAWFGDTREPFLHNLIARQRAIETRRDLVRSVNTGISSHIAATGAIVAQTETWVEATLVSTAAKLDGETVWIRHGDLVTPLCVAWLLAFAWARRLWAVSA